MFIGITGGIAAGKSTVVSFLTARGFLVIDCDKLAREAVMPGSDCMADIRRVFGATVFLPDGNLNRVVMANEVFSDKTAREKLESIIHPYVERRMAEQYLQASRNGFRTVFADVPLLFEVDWQSKFDEIWLVTCNDEQRYERLMKRDNISRAQAAARIAAQLPQAEKEKLADVIIDNSHAPAVLKEQLEKLVEKMEK